MLASLLHSFVASHLIVSPPLLYPIDYRCTFLLHSHTFLLFLISLQLIFTKSGKEYLTPKQLRNEIEDEILAAGGRIALVELQPLVNVDMNHIEDMVGKMVNNHSLRLVNGQLITKYVSQADLSFLFNVR